MNDAVKLLSRRLIQQVSTTHYRSLYHKFHLEDRLSGIIGPRGVGKTTLMLQYLKNHFLDSEEAIYFSADHVYFNATSLYAFVEDRYLTDGVRYVFIDEVHKYKNWNQEIKNLYDGFPDLTIVFSGSSSIDLIKGSYDLSRRAVLYNMHGLSFREYLNFNTKDQFDIISFDDLIKKPQQLNALVTQVPKLKGHFKDYLKQGYYPFTASDPLRYYEALIRVIEKTIYEDIANYYKLKTENLSNFKRLLRYIASIKPGTISVHNISKNMSIDDKTAANYLTYLAETGLVRLIYPAEPGNSSLRRPEKIFLDNTNLQYALETQIGPDVEIGSIRELYFIQSIKNAGLEIFSCKQGDYQVNNVIFEIGGKNKTRAQIKNIEKAFLIKDDIYLASKREIPLLFFGFIS